MISTLNCPKLGSGLGLTRSIESCSSWPLEAWLDRFRQDYEHYMEERGKNVSKVWRHDVLKNEDPCFFVQTKSK